jgi:hypothetical protein
MSSWYYTIAALALAAGIYKYIEYKGLAYHAIWLFKSHNSLLLSSEHCQVMYHWAIAK